MTDGQFPEPGVQGRREQVVERLMENFANDVIDLDEFERRIDIAQRSATAAQLEELVVDLPSGSSVQMRQADASLEPRQMVTVPAHQVQERGFVMACMGGTDRKGRWVPARRTNVVTFMGGVALDFREAMLGPGVTEVWTFSMWGGVDIVVPPGMAVEVDGFALMGGFDFDSNEPGTRHADQPILRIRGMAVMGGVSVTVREVGETTGDARRRRKLERKLQKQQRRRLKSG